MITAQSLIHPTLSHGFFGREGGQSSGVFASLNCVLGSGDERVNVLANRAHVASELVVQSAPLLTPHQVHSANVLVVREAFGLENRPKVDGLVTDTPDLIIGVLTADCGPLLFADPEAGIIGAAHAGWKGAFSGIAEAMIECMERLGAKRSRLRVVLGPMISQANYEVGPEFFERFPESAHRHFNKSPRTGHYLFDLPGYILERLRSFGVANAVHVNLCTYADEKRFFSYRRATHRGETDYGRQISAITLVTP